MEKVLLLPSTQAVHPLEEAVQKIHTVYETETAKKGKNLFRNLDRTPNHPILTYEQGPYTRTSFEKTELLVPIDEEHRVPIAVLAMASAAPHFDLTVLIGNDTKRMLVDLYNDISPHSVEHAKEAAERAKCTGTVVQNILHGVRRAQERGFSPQKVYWIAADCPNVTSREFEGVIAQVEREWKDQLLYAFCNSKVNGQAARFPRCYVPFLGIKEGNAYVFSKEVVSGECLELLQTMYGARKMLTPEGKRNLISLIKRPLTLAAAARRMTLRAHQFHNLICDIDSFEDLAYQYAFHPDKRAHPQYPILRRIAQALADPATVRGTAYEHYDERLSAVMDDLRIPPTLFVEGRSYRADLFLGDRLAKRA